MISLRLAIASLLCLTSLLTLKPAHAANLPTVFAGVSQVQTLGASKVRLNWDRSTVPDAFAFNVYETSSDEPVLLGTVHGNLSTLTVSSLAPATLYKFRVRSVAQDGLEDQNTIDLPAIAYGGLADVRVLASTSVQLSFASAETADAIEIYCHSDLAPLDLLVAEIKDTTQTSTVVNGLIAGQAYTCRAAARIGKFVDNNQITTTFTPSGTAANLIFSIQPGSAVAGRPLTPSPVIVILDADGHVVVSGPDSTATITLSLAAGFSSGTLRGVTSVTAVNGVATFTGLSIREIGEMEITATKADTMPSGYGSPSLSTNSAPFASVHKN